MDIEERLRRCEVEIEKMKLGNVVTAVLCALLAVFLFAMILLSPKCVHAADFSTHVGQSNLGVSVGDVSWRGSTALTEFAIAEYGPQLWGKFLFSLPQTWEGEFQLPDKWKYATLEFDKGLLKTAFKTSGQRLELGTYLYPMLKPYLAAQWIRSELELTQEGQQAAAAIAAASTQGKRFSEVRHWSLMGGGVRCETWTPPLLVFVDASVFNNAHRLECGFRCHYQAGYFGAVWRHDRLNFENLTGTGNAWFGEFGYVW